MVYAADEEKRQVLTELCGTPIEGGLPARSLLEMIHQDLGVDAVRERVSAPLKGLRVAPYYGCLLTRPARLMGFDSVENPVSMDELMVAAGAEVVDFPFKVECCGASYGVPQGGMVRRLSGRILEMAARQGANVIVVCCPMCHQNLDLRQGQLEAAPGSRPMPVLYFTQALGLAMGIEPKKLGLDKHAVSTAAIVRAATLPPQEQAPATQGRVS